VARNGRLPQCSDFVCYRGLCRRHTVCPKLPAFRANQLAAVAATAFMMGWTPRPTASMCQSGGVEHHLREASVSEVSIIGLDISKHVFHAHGADGRGRAMFTKRISRGKLLDFFATQPSCTIALEACGGAHHWARQLAQLGHEVRLCAASLKVRRTIRWCDCSSRFCLPADIARTERQQLTSPHRRL
jgi:hypothetical protein